MSLMMWTISILILSSNVHILMSAPDNQLKMGGDDLPHIYRTVCIRNAEGCPCYDSADKKANVVLRVNHFFPVYNPSSVINGMRKIKIHGRECYYPQESLKEMPYSPVLKAEAQDRDHIPLDLKTLVNDWPQTSEGVTLSGKMDQVLMGYYWPTFYHMAMEEFHPGRKVPILSLQGKRIGLASKEFLRQVTWEGSGITIDGKRIRYAGKRGRYAFYNDAKWGWGAGYSYRIFPYRTIAVNYPGVCRALKNRIPGCNKKKVIGTMVYIKEIAEKKIPMPGGQIHDGYFCMTDTGSPHYIRSDRIDIFVGTHGGGNPYLPPGRRRNNLIDGGIRALVPYDWKYWTSEKNRYWCPSEKIPDDPYNVKPGDCALDYHATAPEKSLHMYVLFHKDGRPVKCKKNPLIR